MNAADGYDEVVRTIAQALQPDAELRLDSWSEDNVVLPKGSPFPGPYQLSHTPYARRILQCLSPGHPSSRVVAMVASQLLKTQTAINAILGWIDSAPSNMLALEPSDKLAKRLSSRISKAIASCDAVRDKVARPRSRDNRNTIDCKEFEGGELHIVTSGSANNLAEMSARYLFADEVDRMQVIPNEGHPCDIALARLTQFRGISKAYLVSTPLVLGFSRIEQLHAEGTREQYHVPCPHCGHLHPLEREHFRYSYDADARRVSRAWFVCPECGAEIEEHHKRSMLPEESHGGRARWVAQSHGDGETVSFHLPAYYAPLGPITWADLGLQLARAREREKLGDPEPMRTDVNTREGLPYDGTQTTTTASKLMARAEAYPLRTVPDPALVVTMFADTQPTRLEVTIEAWGPGLEHWVLDHVVLWGSPTAAPDSPGSVWQQLDELRRTPFLHASGASLYASAYGIDSGGANTQDVYNYGHQSERWTCLVTKGHSTREKPIIASAPSKMDVDWQGKRLPEGVKLWMLGVDTAKAHLFNRLHLPAGPGAHHFPQGLDLAYYEGLLAEKPQTRWNKGRAITDWIKPAGAANEPLDCAVGNLALAHYLTLHRFSVLDWQRLRARVIPAQVTPDLFATAALQQSSVATPSAAQPPVTLADDHPQQSTPPSLAVEGVTDAHSTAATQVNTATPTPAAFATAVAAAALPPVHVPPLVQPSCTPPVAVAASSITTPAPAPPLQLAMLHPPLVGRRVYSRGI